MKKLVLTIVTVVAFVGCTTQTQRTSFNTIGTLLATSDAAIDSYDQLLIQHVISTNSMPQVNDAYKQLHATLTLAAITTQAGTNAIAPANLTAEVTAFANMVASFETSTNK